MSLVWVWSPAALAFQPTDAGAQASFYKPLATYVQSLPGGVQRLEVVPTASMRQADELALAVPLARGWQTQLDRRYNRVLFQKVLSAAEYPGWLLDNAVALVALPKAPLYLTATAALAIGIGAIVRNVAGAIGAFVGILLVLPVIASALPPT